MSLHRDETPAEIVVTVPKPFGPELAAQFGLRTTLGVLTELLASSKDRVIISAPFIQGEEGLNAGPLGMALGSALRRGVRVDLISTGTSLSILKLNNLKAIAEYRFRAYQPRQNLEDTRTIGSHAKFCIADGKHAYVGSANLTQKGISGHLEIGVLLHGAAARHLWKFVLRLFEIDYLVESST